MTIPGYNIKKAAQVVAFFATKEGGAINVLKLGKLLYLGDRESLKKYDYPILYDNLVSLDNGPVDSATLNFINGLSEDEAWDAYVNDRAGHTVGLTRRITFDELDELSVANLEVLETVWAAFGAMGKYEIRDYTHDHCPEWEDPKGSSDPIPYERVFKFLGKQDSAALAKAVEEERYMLTAC